MEITSADGSFAVRLEPTSIPGYESRIFVLQLRVGEVWFGDGIPTIEWSSVERLSGLPVIDDDRLDPTRHTPQEIRSVLVSEDEPELYDATLGGFSESFDSVVTRTYIHGDKAVLLFWEPEPGAPWSSGPIHLAVLSTREMDAIAKATRAAHDAYVRSG